MNASSLPDYPDSPAPFHTIADFLLHLIGESPAAVALGTPGDATPHGRSTWAPSRVAPGELRELIGQHIAGKIRPREAFSEKHGTWWQEHKAKWLGAYVIHHDEDGHLLCNFVVLDFDVAGHGHARGLSQDQVNLMALMVYDAAVDAGLNPVLERSCSGRGWHLWVVFDRPRPAEFAHWLGKTMSQAVADETGLPAPESFPKQSDPKTLGNLICLPFTGAPRGTAGGRLVDRNGELMPVTSVRLSDPAQWVKAWEESSRLVRIALLQEKNQVLFTGTAKADGVLADSVTCEIVAEQLAPKRITDRTDSELFMDCPRHASRSRRSMGVARGEGGGWWCFNCCEGGGSYKLAQWLLPQGARHSEIMKALKYAAGATP